MATSISFSSIFMDQLSNGMLETWFLDIARTRAKDLAHWIGGKDMIEEAPDEVLMYVHVKDNLWIEYRYRPEDDELTVTRMIKQE